MSKVTFLGGGSFGISLAILLRKYHFTSFYSIFQSSISLSLTSCKSSFHKLFRHLQNCDNHSIKPVSQPTKLPVFTTITHPCQKSVSVFFSKKDGLSALQTVHLSIFMFYLLYKLFLPHL